MLFKNIFVPFDGSKYSIHALNVALDIAQKYNSKVTIAHCIQKPFYTGDSFTDRRLADPANKRMKMQAKEILGQAEKIAKKRKLSVRHCILKSDSVVKKLVSFCKSMKMDLVVIGTHGRTGWKKIMLGSVAQGVSQNVHCPVLLVR